MLPLVSRVFPVVSLQGFFKRSTLRGDKYKCFFGGQCVLSPQNRNRCKACRFQRCLTAGMSLDGKSCLQRVRLHRTPGFNEQVI